MGYAVKQDMIDRFGETEIRQLTDKADPPTGAINDVVLGRALADADGYVDAALNGRYALPLVSIPKILVAAACNIARYQLYEDAAGEEVKRRFDDARKFLEAVSKGTMTLGVDGAGVSVPPAAGGVEFNDSRRAFGGDQDRKSTRLNSSHIQKSRMPSSA